MTGFPSNCVVKGHQHTVIQDLTQSSFVRIPNESNGLSEKATGNDNGFAHDTWETPSVIDNGIIEISEGNTLLKWEPLRKLCEQLELLLCQNLAVVFRGYMPLKTISDTLGYLDRFNFRSITLLLQYHEDYYSDGFADIVLDSPSVFTCGIFQSPFEKNFSNLIHFTERPLQFVKTKRPTEFSSTVPLFLEAHHSNPYFNKKIYIGANGDIKNAPETLEVFGNIVADPGYLLADIVSQESFQSLWGVHKDLCEVCRDCEYRYMCVDNRLPSKKGEGEWYYEEPCNYDPHKGEWNIVK